LDVPTFCGPSTDTLAGKPVSHQFAKELLVGFAGAEAEKLIETKGLDFVDRERAKHQAQQNAEHLYDEHYVRDQGADQYDPYGPKYPADGRQLLIYSRNQYQPHGYIQNQNW
jgi:hypothetical protein